MEYVSDETKLVNEITGADAHHCITQARVSTTF